ncbi:MAG: hypothetical protein DCC51_16405 [Anaerolineae bacterium]|nr:MAG: hypothetical protein DCC51_16405 [Anaerolineae bacterium]
MSPNRHSCGKVWKNRSTPAQRNCKSSWKCPPLVPLVRASRAGVMLLDEDTGELIPHTLRPERAMAEIDLSTIVQVAQVVLAGSETLYVEPVLERGLREPGALVPLQGGRFTREQLALFQSIADQLSIAIENARYFAKGEEAAAAAERNRLARDLHDAVTQTLFSAGMIAEVLPKIMERNPAEGFRRLEELRQLTRGALSEMRTLLVELRPAALNDTDLADLLGHQVNAFVARARLPVAYEHDCICNPPVEIKEVFYRIAQEAFNNIVRHAEAGHVRVHLDCRPGEATLAIEDDGIGFDVQAHDHEGLGLGIMRERARSVGARLEIDSRLHHGTRLRLIWQTPNQEEET